MDKYIVNIMKPVRAKYRLRKNVLFRRSLKTTFNIAQLD